MGEATSAVFAKLIKFLHTFLILISIILYNCSHHTGPQKISNHALANSNWYFYNIDKGYILEDGAEWLYETQE